MATTNEQIMKELGVLSAKVEHLQDELDRVQMYQRKFQTSWDQIDGGRKLALTIFTVFGAAAGAIGGLIAWFWTNFKWIG